jgi:hypothetical protein
LQNESNNESYDGGEEYYPLKDLFRKLLSFEILMNVINSELLNLFAYHYCSLSPHTVFVEQSPTSHRYRYTFAEPKHPRKKRNGKIREHSPNIYI